MTSAKQDSVHKPSPVHAISLLSGGLDSQLAVRLLQLQGIEVHAIVFESVFFNTAPALRAAQALGTPVIAVDFTDTIRSLLQNPRHGFGGHMNPCIDCHIAMIRKAGQVMERDHFDFISTGEVLRQRPMSQNMSALELIAVESGYPGLILRPLTAKLLPPTVPETHGQVDRNQLLALEGRGRKPQIELATRMGISDYPQPAGGCLLTDPRYSERLKELQRHEGLAGINLVKLLRVGRHFRIGGVKLIVGRDCGENEIIEQAIQPGNILLKSESVPGPSALLAGNPDAETLRTAAGICARYADCPAGEAADIVVAQGGEKSSMGIIPATDDSIRQFIV